MTKLKKNELKQNQTILFIGDSITDADRLLPAYEPFGSGYVHFTANFLLAKYPELNLNIINTGISGNTIRDLKARWQKDCIEHKPDILSILIGANDCWRWHAEPECLPEAVYPDEYEKTYRQLLSVVNQQCNCEIVLIEPFMFCGDFENKMFQDLKAYIEIVQTLSDEFNAVSVNLQTLIDEKIKQIQPEKWSEDMVHPYIWAHQWIAQQWLKIVMGL